MFKMESGFWIRSAACAGLIFGCAVAPASGQYGATPLRGALAPEPHFNTGSGRDGHRFEAAPINKYRLYDFYNRQAKYRLANGEIPDLLLPYPGLQGGRQGHWGNTNEAAYSAVRDREVEPEHHRLVGRRNGMFVYLGETPDREGKAVGEVDPSTGRIVRVVVDASLATPVFWASHKVDRYGFSIGLHGADYLIGPEVEWLDSAGAPVAVDFPGYYVHGERVVFRRQIGGVDVLDLPGVRFDGGIPVYDRTFEWEDAAAGLSFALPAPSAAFAEAGATMHEERKHGVLRLILEGSIYRVVHEIACKEGAVAVSHGVSARVNLPAFQAGDRLRISSWIMKREAAARTWSAEVAALSPLTKGGPAFYDKTVTVQGVLDADPAAKGSGYSIDDVPVPSKNPYGTPMTTSGLAFDRSGAAYISTLVGDIWKVTGLTGDLSEVTWKRFASGIPNPLGLEMVDDVLFVTAVGKIMCLHDYNRDGEADYYERFTQQPLELGGMGSENQNLERDAAGNFYVCGAGGIMRISPDGRTMEVISDSARNPLGLAVRGDGLALSDSSEGYPKNGTCTIYESHHAENQNSVAKRKRILYLPRGVDNSPGGRLFLDHPGFGPLGKSILGVSYGSGSVYVILRDPNGGTPQAALFPLPMEISSGAARIAEQPGSREIFVVGLDGWGDVAVTEGSLNRIRYTGEPTLVPTGWRAYRNGLSVTFNLPLKPGPLSPDGLFLQQWNYCDYTNIYGSPEFSVKDPQQIGHDHVKISSVHLSDDRKTIFLEAPELLPAMCTHLHGGIVSSGGLKLELDLYATLNQLNGDHPAAPAYSGGKPLDLKVPDVPGTTDTYTVLTGFFDKRGGRDVAGRPVGEAVPYQPGDLGYDWIRTNLIEKQCLPCHGPGTPHDYTTYEGLLAKIDPIQPEKSALIGLLETGSMPPHPLPSVAPEMIAALRKWVAGGLGRKTPDNALPSPIPVREPVKVSGLWVGRENELSDRHLVDGNFSTIWAAPEGARSGWIEIDLGEAQEVSTILLDDSPYARTRGFEIKFLDGESWKTIASGETIGVRKRISFGHIVARRFRIEILNATEVPVISEIQFFP